MECSHETIFFIINLFILKFGMVAIKIDVLGHAFRLYP